MAGMLLAPTGSLDGMGMLDSHLHQLSKQEAFLFLDEDEYDDDDHAAPCAAAGLQAAEHHPPPDYGKPLLMRTPPTMMTSSKRGREEKDAAAAVIKPPCEGFAVTPTYPSIGLPSAFEHPQATSASAFLNGFSALPHSSSASQQQPGTSSDLVASRRFASPPLTVNRNADGPALRLPRTSLGISIGLPNTGELRLEPPREAKDTAAGTSSHNRPQENPRGQANNARGRGTGGTGGTGTMQTRRSSLTKTGRELYCLAVVDPVTGVPLRPATHAETLRLQQHMMAIQASALHPLSLQPIAKATTSARHTLNEPTSERESQRAVFAGTTPHENHVAAIDSDHDPDHDLEGDLPRASSGSFSGQKRGGPCDCCRALGESPCLASGP